MGAYPVFGLKRTRSFALVWLMTLPGKALLFIKIAFLVFQVWEKKIVPDEASRQE